MALETAVCASSESLIASLFSSLPTLRISVDSSMWATMSATIFWASAMASTSSADFETPFSIFVASSSYLSTLSTREVLDFSSSWSHQCLCSSSFFCSSMRRKIIFSTMLLTSSKGPVRWAATWAASCSRAREWATLAAERMSSTAFIFGSLDAAAAFSSRRATGEGGGTGFSGASVRTPETLARMPMATLMASSSLERVLERSAHSLAFRLAALSVAWRVAVSAARSSSVSSLVPLASARSSSVWPSSLVRAVLEAEAASMRSWRAALASAKALREFVSAFSVSSSSSWNFDSRPFRSSTTLPDLKA
mmetsp:Transcript_72794/g.157379  ORF Transcript_72794/g.157379 Transcript_72794/m.157379 type:complete len:308 (+) Transcript_72794:314-1237(+)